MWSAHPYWKWHNRNVKHSNSRKTLLISTNWVHVVRWFKAHSALVFSLISIESLFNPAPFSGQQAVILLLVMLHYLKWAPTCWWERRWRWRALHRDQQPFHPHTEQLLDGDLHRPQSHKQRTLASLKPGPLQGFLGPYADFHLGTHIVTCQRQMCHHF